jgi:HK97 family phage prohead protease
MLARPLLLSWGTQMKIDESLETRSGHSPFELRESAPGGGIGKLVGYAAKFGPQYELCPGFVETVAPGCFSRTLKEKPDVRALYNHDSGVVLARTPKTLRLREDKVGLAFEIDLPDTQAGRDLKASVARGDIDGMSFGFQVIHDTVEHRSDGTSLRTLVDVSLEEVSVVAFPAYQETEVALRSLRGALGRRGSRLPMIRRKLQLLGL